MQDVVRQRASKSEISMFKHSSASYITPAKGNGFDNMIGERQSSIEYRSTGERSSSVLGM